MHTGRSKPIDTLAREEIKQIYGRETIKLMNEDGDFVAAWQPVAALLDWSVRPDYWNNQPFISVEYLPLKRALLATSVKAALTDLAAKSSVSPADKAAIEAVAKLDEVGAKEIQPLLASKTLDKADMLTLARLHAKLGEGHKWLTPHELEEAQLKVDGRPVPFAEWIDGIAEKNRVASEMPMGVAKLTDIEEKGYEVGTAYARYRALRDREMTRLLPVLLMPRPSNASYITYSGEALKKAQKGSRRDLSLIELETAVILNKYLEDLPSKDWAEPGKDATFDARYAAWLKEKSAWIPMTVMLQAAPEDLAKAGFPVSKVEAFRAAFKTMEEAERSTPGKIGEGPAVALVHAARDLGVALNEGSYPTEAHVAREVSFNTTAPFFWAPAAYGLGTVLLILSLTVQSSRSSVVQTIQKGLYATGMLGFVSGIGLEVYGFSQRVMISGWAPVTNMYETVIWVAMVTSVIGLILEAIYRKTFAALAASGVAMCATAIAATVPLLDPSIHGLQPVLRSNLWLTIHVLTIVSSYAAFALSMGLGLIATSYYLTATYRRSASYLSLLLPLLPGGLIGGAGYLAMVVAGQSIGRGGLWGEMAFWGSVGLMSVGGVMAGSGPVALLGEVLNRSLFLPKVHDLASNLWADRKTSREKALALEEAGVMPPITGGGPLSEADLRAEAMRETAAKIKPLSNFIYRSMQVGVLLVAAGTILGGVWADYSWGRFWGWDAKEVWALITLLVYLVPLHGRFAGWVNTFGLVVASVVCFLSVLMAWYGVNFILGVGLHAYGFVKGGSQGTVGLVTLAVLAIPAGAAWRRYLSQRQDVAVA